MMKKKTNLFLMFVMPFLVLCLSATNASGAWVTTTVDSAWFVGGHTSIALDSSGKSYISCRWERKNVPKMGVKSVPPPRV